MTIALIIAGVLAVLFSALSLATHTDRIKRADAAWLAADSPEEKFRVKVRTRVERGIHAAFNIQALAILYVVYFILWNTQ